MIDLTPTIEAKSNQLNADDLIGRDLIITITNVSAASQEQPIAIRYQNDNNKPWYPCKSMRRVLVQAWGKDGKAYIGRSLRLYRDATVTFGGIAVGGIRISEMSHINSELSIPLAISRGSRKMFKVKPLKQQPIASATTEEKEANAEKAANRIKQAINNASDDATKQEIIKQEANALSRLKEAYPDKYDSIMELIIINTGENY